MGDGSKRGRLKVFLGYAAGVGKTYQMLAEGKTLSHLGRDVVLGYFEPHGRKDTIAQTAGMEFVPRRAIEYRGSRFEEMDTEAILQRRPEVCLVDEFPHTNVPGSERAKRWQDVTVLLEQGIDVLTTMNIQHLESLNDQVRNIAGVRVRETIPDWVVKQADEVVLVDLTPDALLNRLRRGVVYAPEKATAALRNFFRQPTLAALREMAMRQTAHQVDVRQSQPETEAARDPSARTGPQERLLLHITPDPSTAALIRRGRRVADYLDAPCVAVAVQTSKDLRELGAADRERLEKHLAFARNLHIDTRILEGTDAAATLVEFARANGITQVFVARPKEAEWSALLGRSVIQRIVRLAQGMRVTVVARRGPA
jgi:two-component system sensor histidine kinase KdpD